MNTSRADAWQELDRLIEGACDQTLLDAEMKTLSDWLVKDPAACDRYIAQTAIHRRLAWCMMPTRSFSPSELHRYAQVELDTLETESSCLPSVHISVLPTPHGPVGWFSSEWLVSYAIATVIFAVAALIGANTYVKHYTQVAHDSAPVGASNPQSPIPNPSPKAPFVARITGMVDCKWAKKGTDPVYSERARRVLSINGVCPLFRPRLGAREGLWG